MKLQTGLTAATIWASSAAVVFADHFGPLQQIKLGAKMVVYSSELLLLPIAVGLVLSYWSRRDAVVGFAAFFGGVILGFPFDYIFRVDVSWICLLLAICFGGMVALQVSLPVRVLQASLVFAGMNCAPLVELGRYFEQVSMLVVGNFVFSLFLVLFASYLVCVTLGRFSKQYWWIAIILRVLGSWVAAASIIIFSFQLSGLA